MSYQTHYGGVIWTNHAQERLTNRGVSQAMAIETFKSPDNSIPGKNPGTFQYQKRIGTSTITLVTKQNQRKEWIILSGWIDPPIRGTQEFKNKQEWKKYQKSGFWGKVWYQLKLQLGMS